VKTPVLIGLACLALLLGVGIGFVVKPEAPSPPAPGATTGMEQVAKEVLTPGGSYTQADIEANGIVSPFDKYARTMLGDDANAHQAPKVGDVRCPITGSRGTMTWIINGRTYYFCCPPCIIEFVGKAKTDPESIAAPETYLVTEANIDSLPPPTMGPTE